MAKNASSEKAKWLENVVYLSVCSRVMLKSNLWSTAGLVNEATGTGEKNHL